MVNHPVSQITLDGELVSYTEGETLYAELADIFASGARELFTASP